MTLLPAFYWAVFSLQHAIMVDGPAGPAAIAQSADTDDPKPRRHMIEHLARNRAARHVGPNWLRCSFLMMRLRRSISAFASLRLARSAASELKERQVALLG